MAGDRIFCAAVFLGVAVLWGCGQEGDLSPGEWPDALEEAAASSPFFSLGEVDEGLYPIPELGDELEADCRPAAWRGGDWSLDARRAEAIWEGDSSLVRIEETYSPAPNHDPTGGGSNIPSGIVSSLLIFRSGVFVRTSAGWELNKVSPVEMKRTGWDESPAGIRRVWISIDGDLLLEAESSGELFEVKRELPLLIPGDEILFEAAVLSSSPPSCGSSSGLFLHYHGNTGASLRVSMVDDGTRGDRLSGDGIYSRRVAWDLGPGHHLALINLMDSQGVLSGWGLPLRVAATVSGVMGYRPEEECWTLSTDDGESYHPLGGHPELYEENLRVRILGLPRLEKAGGCAGEPSFEVLSFRPDY